MDYENIYHTVPLVISFTLYNYNYIDNKLIAEIKNKCFIISKTNNSITIPVIELHNVINNSFRDEFNDTDIYPQDRIQHGLNTVYQIKQLIDYYQDLKIININISYKRNYNKLVKFDNGISMSSLDFKIERGILKYDEYLTDKQIQLLNKLLKDIGVVETLNILSSYTIHVNDYIDMIESLDAKKKIEYKEIIEFNNNIFSDKLKLDNTVLILVTDF